MGEYRAQISAEFAGNLAWARWTSRRQGIEVGDRLLDGVVLNKPNTKQLRLCIGPQDRDDKQRFSRVVMHNVVDGVRLNTFNARDALLFRWPGVLLWGRLRCRWRDFAQIAQRIWFRKRHLALSGRRWSLLGCHEGSRDADLSRRQVDEFGAEQLA